MEIEVVYGTAETQRVVRLEVVEGTTVYEAATLSNLELEFPEIDLESIPMGVFGVRVKMATTTILHPGDRVELYRPLIVDPKESRRSRAEFQKRGRVQK
ncbi:RnfH family protein [Litorivicinus sp.]|jgi:putative ubiquitin-RnfH superfamily antitoxin RatB of RatAB toxin-antitoxin module|nr:RnfH family protein [Litorivicinus sp.]